MNERILSDRRLNLVLAIAGVAMGWLCWNPGGVCCAQTPPANLSPGLQEVIKLTQAHMGDDVILAYIKNSGTSYSLSANDILYLNSQGVSQPVLSTLLQSKPAADSNPPPSVPPPVAPPTDQQNYGPGPGSAPVSAPQTFAPDSAPPPSSAPEVNFNYFHDQLAPYGSWIDMPGYGPCFRPTEASNPGWRPYCDGGHWVYTDDGWFWQSDYTWGEIAFHYGRWHYSVNYGWVWMPAYDYAPAWVCWRHAEGEGYCGWAPLPPTAVFRAGVGLTFNGRVGLDIDFGLNQTYFTFVAFDHFWDHDFRRYVVPRDRVAYFYRTSLIVNNYRVVNGRFVVEGLGHERMAALTHHEVRVERVAMHDARIAHHVEERRAFEEHAREGGRDGGFDRRTPEENLHTSKAGYQDAAHGKTTNGKQSGTNGNKAGSQNKPEPK
jgi:hypothetical protein